MTRHHYYARLVDLVDMDAVTVGLFAPGWNLNLPKAGESFRFGEHLFLVESVWNGGEVM
jgi:hypothetical protein